MHPERNTIATSLIWIAAIALLFQQTSMIRCNCASRDEQNSINKNSCACSLCEHNHEALQCRARVTLAASSITEQEFPSPSAPLGPCNCPSSCPCHLRHVDQPVQLVNNSLDDHSSDHELPSTSFPNARRHLTNSAVCHYTHSRVVPLASSEYLAVICRFNI